MAFKPGDIVKCLQPNYTYNLVGGFNIDTETLYEIPYVGNNDNYIFIKPMGSDYIPEAIIVSNIHEHFELYKSESEEEETKPIKGKQMYQFLNEKPGREVLWDDMQKIAKPYNEFTKAHVELALMIYCILEDDFKQLKYNLSNYVGNFDASIILTKVISLLQDHMEISKILMSCKIETIDTDAFLGMLFMSDIPKLGLLDLRLAEFTVKAAYLPSSTLVELPAVQNLILANKPSLFHYISRSTNDEKYIDMLINEKYIDFIENSTAPECTISSKPDLIQTLIGEFIYEVSHSLYLDKIEITNLTYKENPDVPF